MSKWNTDYTPTLLTLENNARAKRLYDRLGFSETGRRNVITGGLDEIELSWSRVLRQKGNNNAIYGDRQNFFHGKRSPI